MFTGIIQEIGKISYIKSSSFTVSAKKILKWKKIGDSIAVNGACVSITKLTSDSFSFTAISETLRLTNFKLGANVNLESSLKLGDTLDGHFVTGHIDGLGKVKEFKKNKLQITFPKQLKKFIALKGSICINGVSLTISGLFQNTFQVDLIPLTLSKTNLSLLKKGDKVNLEIDLIARYLNQLKK